MTDTLPCMKVAGGRGVIAEWLVLWSIIRKFRDETNTSTEVLLREFFWALRALQSPCPWPVLPGGRRACGRLKSRRRRSTRPHGKG